LVAIQSNRPAQGILRATVSQRTPVRFQFTAGDYMGFAQCGEMRGAFDPVSLATSPSGPEPLTILSRAWILPGSMLRLLVALLPTLFSAMRSRRHLVIENLALRQQLATFASRLHPDIRPSDRVFWVLLRRYWSRWAGALAIVRPDTVVRWHRTGSPPLAARGRTRSSSA